LENAMSTVNSGFAPSNLNFGTNASVLLSIQRERDTSSGKELPGEPFSTLDAPYQSWFE